MVSAPNPGGGFFVSRAQSPPPLTSEMQTRHRWIGALGHGKFSCIRYLLGRHVINLQRWWLD